MTQTADKPSSIGDLPETFGVHVAARALGVSVGAIYRVIASKELFAVQPGRSWIISRTALMRYVGAEQ